MNTSLEDFIILFVIGTYVYMSFISRTMKKERYKYRVILAFISFFIGVLIDQLELSEEHNGFYTSLGILPSIYLIHYELLKRIMIKWIGKYPYSPFQDKIGENVDLPGYPLDRKVTEYDYVFGIILLVGPVITWLILNSYFK